MTIPFEKLKARLLANLKVRAEYDALAPEFEIAAELLKARQRAGLSQSELAAKMGTSQSTVARLESGQTLPSTKTLLRFAKAVNLYVPPLRHRREDIPMLIEHFVEEFSEKNGVASEGFTTDATEELLRYGWPGNVRELRNVIESIIVLENGKRLTADDIRRYLPLQQPQESERHLPVVTSKSVAQAERELIYRALLDLKSDIGELKEYLRTARASASGNEVREVQPAGNNGAYSLDAMEREMIMKALERHQGNRRMAARELNISERTLYRKIKEYGPEFIKAVRKEYGLDQDLYIQYFQFISLYIDL